MVRVKGMPVPERVPFWLRIRAISSSVCSSSKRSISWITARFDLRRTNLAVIQEIDRLLDEHTEEEIALILNQKGTRSGTGIPFTRTMISYLRCSYNLMDRFTRLRAAGKLTAEE